MQEGGGPGGEPLLHLLGDGPVHVALRHPDVLLLRGDVLPAVRVDRVRRAVVHIAHPVLLLPARPAEPRPGRLHAADHEDGELDGGRSLPDDLLYPRWI